MRRTLGGVAMALVAVLTAAACDDDDGGASAASAPDAGDDGSTASADSGSSAEAGGETGADAAAAASLGPGPYTLVYAGTVVGIDARPIAPGKATFDGIKLVAYESSADEHPALGTNGVQEASGDAFVAIGRWAGGATTGKFYTVNGTGLIDLPANGGFHYAIGNFTDPLPSSGSATYTELSKTAASVSDGSVAPGTISGSIAATFAGADTKIGFSIDLDIPGDAKYTLATTGGTSDVSKTEATISSGQVKGAFFTTLNLTSTGAACGGSCSAVVDGFVAGPNADRIALVAHVFNGGGGSPKSVAAAIAFKR